MREEAYRVANGFLDNRRVRPAYATARSFYLPNLQPTASCVKETVRLTARTLASLRPTAKSRKVPLG